jgi:hypothetical protein
MKLRLTKRFADAMDGISLAGCRIGDVIDFPPDEARVLLASEWAVIAEPHTSEVVRREHLERSLQGTGDRRAHSSG